MSLAAQVCVPINNAQQTGRSTIGIPLLMRFCINKHMLILI